MRILFLLATVLACVVAPARAQIPNQPNAPGASLVFAGIDHAPGGAGPITVNVASVAVSMAVSGVPNSPYLLAFSPGNSVVPGVSTPAGTLHLPLVGLTTLLDGFFFTISPFDLFANSGQGTSIWSLPACTTLLSAPHSWQALVADPGSPSGVTLTASSDVVATCGIVMPLSLTDDSFVSVAQGPLCPLTDFYNMTYSTLYVGSNGFVTFVAGDVNLQEAQSSFDSGSPRIAGAWDDLNPAWGGAIVYAEASWGWAVIYSNVREYTFPAALNSFVIAYDCNVGSVTLDYTDPAGMTLQDALAGITPGGGLASPVTILPSLKPTTCGGALTVPTTPQGPLESLNALYTPLVPFDLSGCAVVFQPSSFGGAGSGVANSYLIL